MSLYKYLPPIRVDVLRGGLISVSPANSRNDPFDELPALDFDFSAENLRQVYNQRPKLQHQWVNAAAYINNRQKYKAALFGPGALKMQEKMSLKFGALCLCKEWNSIPMWSYYAKAHEGFVMEFDEKSKIFKKHFGKGERIQYGPRGKVKGWMLTPTVRQHTRKAASWRHEKEVRFLWAFELGDKRQVEDDENPGQMKTVFLTPFPKETLTAIYLGVRAKPEFVRSIMKNLRKWGFVNARLFHLIPHHEDFQLVPTELRVG